MSQEDKNYVKFIEQCSNHYQVLAVKKDAKTDEINTSFKFLSRKIHPDKNIGMFLKRF